LKPLNPQERTLTSQYPIGRAARRNHYREAI